MDIFAESGIIIANFIMIFCYTSIPLQGTYISPETSSPMACWFKEMSNIQTPYRSFPYDSPSINFTDYAVSTSGTTVTQQNISGTARIISPSAKF
jgi:hypothetical protein